MKTLKQIMTFAFICTMLALIFWVTDSAKDDRFLVIVAFCGAITTGSWLYIYIFGKKE